MRGAIYISICQMGLLSPLLFSSFLSLIKMSIASYTVHAMADEAALRDIRSDEPEKKPAIPRSCSLASASERTADNTRAQVMIRDMVQYRVVGEEVDSLDRSERRLSV
jgi:hypothetical protein